MKRQHRHQTRPGTAWGSQCGGTTECDYARRGDRPCSVTGAHVYVRCRCGATGVICPGSRRIAWHDPEYRNTEEV